MLALRFVKLLGVLALTLGSFGATFPKGIELQTRRTLAYAFAGPGLLVAWVAGFMLAHLQRYPLFSWWIGLSMLTSLLSIQGALYCAGKDGRAGQKPWLWTACFFVATVAFMVWKPGL